MVKNDYMQYGLYPKVGEELECPMCRKIFKATDNTRFIRKGKLVCSWKCFMSDSVVTNLDNEVNPVEAPVTEGKPVKETKPKKRVTTTQSKPTSTKPTQKGGKVTLF